ncbi:hypothetical protein [Methylocella tundrae]|nr:hypothetical protein [Methylocella tundrae]
MAWRATKGVELSGRYEDGAAVRAALLDVGRKHGLRQGGTLAYFSTPSESGWMASPFPAIFTSEKLEAYRRWLPASAWEASAQLGGSFVSNRLEDYDVTPWDLAVDRRMNFDHDFVGRAALGKDGRAAQANAADADLEQGGCVAHLQLAAGARAGLQAAAHAMLVLRLSAVRRRPPSGRSAGGLVDFRGL